MKGVVRSCVFVLAVTIYGIMARTKQERIVGGNSVESSMYPFAVRLVTLISGGRIRTRCGATIIHKKWVVTAAHCLDRFTRLGIDEGSNFIYGNTSYSAKNDGVQHDIISYFIHEKFKQFEQNSYDIALIQVLQPFTEASEKPIAIAPTDYKYKMGSTATVFGWGYIDKAVTKRSDVLRATDISLLPYECASIMYDLTWYNGGTFNFDLDHTICAWSSNKGPCDEDNGGPLVQKNMLIGIVNVHLECASDHFPSFYIKVADFNEWINTVMIQKGKQG